MREDYSDLIILEHYRVTRLVGKNLPRTWILDVPPSYWAVGDIFYPRRAKRALGCVEHSSCTELIDSEMAGPIRLKVGEMVEGMQENVLAKEFF